MPKRIFIAVILLSTFLFGQDTLEWSIHDVMDKAVAGAFGFTFGEDIYISGGVDSEGKSTGVIQKTTPDQNIWSDVGDMDQVRYGHAGAVHGDYVYYFGGTEDTSESRNKLVRWFRYEPESYTIYDSSEYFERKFAQAVINDTTLFIIGGNAATPRVSRQPYIVEYNLTDKEFVSADTTGTLSATTLPEQQMSAVLDGYIYIFGGVNNGISKSIYRFDMSTGRFDTLDAELIKPRAGGKAVVVNNEQIMIIGGFNESNTALASCEIFDVYTFEVDSVQSMKIARAFPVVYTENSFYNYSDVFVYGGFDKNGSVTTTIETTRIGAVTDIHGDGYSEGVFSYELQQNYPNPFNPSTTINYSLARAGNVQINLYDVIGNKIATIAEGYKEAGNYTIEFRAPADMASGLYFYRMTTPNGSLTKKMILMK